MFSPSKTPRVFGLPCGIRFPDALKQGILDRIDSQTPDAIARVEVFVNSSRMKRNLIAAFDDGSTQFIPKVRLITDLGADIATRDVPKGVSGLRRRLELAQLVGRFLDQEPEFAARSSTYDLADSLAGLLAEMHDEGVLPSDIDAITTDDTSGHWVRARQFISIISGFFDPKLAQPPMPEARLRMVVDLLCEQWRAAPPTHPIIVAGSTGSRGTTATFMRLVASLPQGAVVLPGFDFGMNEDVWDKIGETGTHEHPQARFSSFAHLAGLHPKSVGKWTDTPDENVVRNRLISLALRPAPVTDQWMVEGPNLGDIPHACNNLTLIEAPDSRMEAVSIALALRKAADEGRTASLVTPDRSLARHVTATLDRWDISPDDSAGTPLNQTPPGRLLRQIVSLFGRPVSAEDLLILLKHPLVARGATLDDEAKHGRGPHLLRARSLEKYLRKCGPALPARTDLMAWAEKETATDTSKDAVFVWASWVGDILEGFPASTERSLSQHLDDTVRLAEHMVAGPNSHDARELWAQSAGREALRVVTELHGNSEFAAELTMSDFGDLFRSVVGRGLVRDPSPKHSNIMIWGTLEARAQAADVVILGGLNETVWPPTPAPDPWFSRDMRRQAGLLPPEQQIGLSAHDFQQAIGAKEVILARAKRNAEAETVASRWLIRLTNLLQGISQDGADALAQMKSKGDELIALARLLDKPEKSVPAAARPSPRPPVDARPRQLSVTRVETLIRDPYQIYASRILRLNRLDPFSQKPDPRDRGIAYHKIMERFVEQFRDETNAEASDRLVSIAEQVLETTVFWPAARRIWLGRIRKIAPQLVAREFENRKIGRPVGTEVKGGMHFPDIDFSLSCEADRVDRTEGGEYIIYDYKTGAPPTEKQTATLRMQLHLEALMLESAGFDGLPAGRVHEIAYLGLDGKVGQTRIPLFPGDMTQVEEKFRKLVQNYDQADQGYTSRRIVQSVSFAGDFDQLARVGEWTQSDEPVAEIVQ